MLVQKRVFFALSVTRTTLGDLFNVRRYLPKLFTTFLLSSKLVTCCTRPGATLIFATTARAKRDASPTNERSARAARVCRFANAAASRLSGFRSNEILSFLQRGGCQRLAPAESKTDAKKSEEWAWGVGQESNNTAVVKLASPHSPEAN